MQTFFKLEIREPQNQSYSSLTQPSWLSFLLTKQEDCPDHDPDTHTGQWLIESRSFRVLQLCYNSWFKAFLGAWETVQQVKYLYYMQLPQVQSQQHKWSLKHYQGVTLEHRARSKSEAMLSLTQTLPLEKIYTHNTYFLGISSCWWLCVGESWKNKTSLCSTIISSLHIYVAWGENEWVSD